MKNTNVPAIRFKGFDDDWEQRKLGDIYGSIGNAFVGTATPYYAEQGHFYLESNNVKDGQINHNSEVFINDEFYEKQKDKWLHTGDMVMVQSGHVGHAAVIPEELDNTAAHALIMFRNPKEEIEPYFLNYEYQTDKSKKKIENITTGNTIKHILASDMQEFIVDVPKYEEQKVIACYFRNIDYLITLHQRKLEKIKIMRKSMLEKIFPQNDKNSPKIRFDGYTDDWEQRKFSELCDMVTVGIANSATHAYSDSGIVMFRNQNIKPNFLDDNDIIHIKPEFESRYKNKRLKKNDLLVARTGYPGTACVVPEKYENSQTFTTLIARPKNSVNPYFLCQYLNSDIGVKYFESTQIGGGQKNSGAGILNEMPVMLPSGIEEESKIAEYFTNFDHLITLHQRKLEKLKKAKKSMLEQMFPIEK